MRSTNTYFCSALKRLRGTRSQAEMARLIGISQQNYNRYEAGAVLPRLDVLHQIATHFRVTADSLMSEAAPPADHVAEAAAPAYHASPCQGCEARDVEIARLREQVGMLVKTTAALVDAARERQLKGDQP